MNTADEPQSIGCPTKNMVIAGAVVLAVAALVGRRRVPVVGQASMCKHRPEPKNAWLGSICRARTLLTILRPRPIVRELRIRFYKQKTIVSYHRLLVWSIRQWTYRSFVAAQQRTRAAESGIPAGSPQPVSSAFLSGRITYMHGRELPRRAATAVRTRWADCTTSLTFQGRKGIEGRYAVERNSGSITVTRRTWEHPEVLFGVVRAEVQATASSGAEFDITLDLIEQGVGAQRQLR